MPATRSASRRSEPFLSDIEELRRRARSSMEQGAVTPSYGLDARAVINVLQADMIKEDLVAERIAVESYTEMIRYFSDRDPTTRVLMEGIPAKEEEHASDMHDLLVAHEGRPMLRW